MTDQRYLYLVKRVNPTGWDEQDGIVVYAKDAKEARRFAADHHGDEGEGIWFDISAVYVKRLVTPRSINVPLLVLRKFNAG